MQVIASRSFGVRSTLAVPRVSNEPSIALFVTGVEGCEHLFSAERAFVIAELHFEPLFSVHEIIP
jgi:hypothetical protein